MTDLIVLRDKEMPALFRAADLASRDEQRKFSRRMAVYLSLQVIAGVGGLVDIHLRDGTINFGGMLSAASFLGALAVSWSATTENLESNWHQFRACAESVKTLAWRYAVAAEPFPSDMSDTEADELFARRLRDLMNGLRGTVFPPPGNPTQITQQMRQMRALPLSERIDCYAQGRIEEQLTWYTEKALVNRRRAAQWRSAAAVTAIIGLFSGAARAFTIIDLDWLGVLASLSASLTAWTQTRQHVALASNYSIAAQEISLIRDNIPYQASATTWTGFTTDAELAISREHTMWLARRTQR